VGLTQTEIRGLDENGFLVLEDFMSADLLAQLRERVEQLFVEEGVFFSILIEADSSVRRRMGCSRWMICAPC